MEPAPEFGSPPEMDHVTVAAPPEARLAENCSTAVPDELVELQPVQLVSTAPLPGEIEKVPFEEVPEETVPPPQPAIAMMAGSVATATIRAGRERRNERVPPPPVNLERRRPSAVTDALPVNPFSAFPNLPGPRRFRRFGTAPSSPRFRNTRVGSRPPLRCKFRRFLGRKLTCQRENRTKV